MKTINLWANPRNISTAIMYSFAQRRDTTVVDEPLYAYYLQKTGLEHPGTKEILKSQPTEFRKVIDAVYNNEYPTPLAFVKQMSHHIMNENKSFMLECENIILIRNPKRMIQSLSKVIDDLTIDDLGILKSMEISNFLQKHGKSAVILDSDELLKKPEKVLSILCKRISIPFDSAMLSWKAGKRAEDGVWAPYWYSNVHQTTGFSVLPKEDKELPKNYQSLHDECLPFYQQLSNQSIKA